MKRLLCTLFTIMAVAPFTFGQQVPDSLKTKAVRLTKNQADCVGAYLIKDTIFGPVLSPEGFGNKIDIQGNELGDPHWIEREHNTVWYKIKISHTTTMWFDIIPLNENDDFDFLLFKDTGPAFCAKMKKQEVLPVRTNISRNNTTIGGRTGLSPTATEDFVPSGPGSPFSRALEVEKGEVYILCVDNPFRANKGHTIHIHYKDKPKGRQRETDTPKERVIEKHPMTIKVVDEKSGAPVSANLEISGGYNHDFKGAGESYTFDAELYRTYTINCDKAGYMFTTVKQSLMRKESQEVTVKMRKIEPGAKVALPDIQFEANLAIFIGNSKKSLNRLLEFMKANPDVKIEIQGHVNGPGTKNKKKYRNLSNERAKAVFNYLFDNGIDRGRMEYKGYGNAHMLHPEPVNDRQAESNRRVEIKIL